LVYSEFIIKEITSDSTKQKESTAAAVKDKDDRVQVSIAPDQNYPEVNSISKTQIISI